MSKVISLTEYRKKVFKNGWGISILTAERLANERRIEEEKRRDDQLALAHELANDLIAKAVLGLPLETP